MAKTLIELSTEIIQQLDGLAETHKTSRSALIRTAIAAFLKEQRKKTTRRSAFGILKNVIHEDSVEYQRKLRKEWE